MYYIFLVLHLSIYGTAIYGIHSLKWVILLSCHGWVVKAPDKCFWQMFTYRIFPPNGPSFNIYFLASGVAPFKEFFCAGLHPVHYGLPYIYFGHTKWSGCFMMGNIICVIQWVWLWYIYIAHQQRLKVSLRDSLLTGGIRALQWSGTITRRSPAS